MSNKDRGGSNKYKRIEVIFEFLVFGIVIGIIEDVLAVKLTTGEPITWEIIGIIILIAIPFAILGEIVADHVDFVDLAQKFFRRKD